MNRSFGTRIFLVILGLVALIQSVTVVAALDALRKDAIQKANHELEVGQRVFERLLAERASQLSTAVRILASDYGFKEAIATSDTATIESVLANHGGRVQGGPLGLHRRRRDDRHQHPRLHRPVTPTGGPETFPFAAMLTAAARGQSRPPTSCWSPARGAYQIVVTPVRAPELIGWICIGFVIDDALARAFKDLTNLDVSFSPAARPDLLASTLGPDVRRAMPAALGQARRFWTSAGRGAALPMRGTSPCGRRCPAPGTALVADAPDFDGRGTAGLSAASSRRC